MLSLILHSSKSMFLILAITDASITIKANQLVPGERYTLSIEVISNEKDPTLAVWDITVNYPPYNGTCKSTPKTGKSNRSEFCIKRQRYIYAGPFRS